MEAFSAHNSTSTNMPKYGNKKRLQTLLNIPCSPKLPPAKKHTVLDCVHGRFSYHFTHSSGVKNATVADHGEVFLQVKMGSQSSQMDCEQQS